MMKKLKAIIIITTIYLTFISPVQAYDWGRVLGEVIEKGLDNIGNNPQYPDKSKQKENYSNPYSSRQPENDSQQYSKGYDFDNTQSQKQMIIEAQNHLNRLGYNVGFADGIFGKKQLPRLKHFRENMVLLSMES
nr:hypothetical protein [Methylomarinum sp. Ch1-1]MDP4518986.1 hypothetical protein [Methylomarinum sp. Ch1-1]MDP4523384.1 hypothetical protein [Methylomarinum sp. Ch1-1]